MVRTFSDGLSEQEYIAIYDALANKDVKTITIQGQEYKITKDKHGYRTARIKGIAFVGHVKKI